jgi:hypothetical protein
LEELFGQRLRSLSSLGIGPEDVRGMIEKSLTFLTAPGGVQVSRYEFEVRVALKYEEHLATLINAVASLTDLDQL